MGSGQGEDSELCTANYIRHLRPFGTMATASLFPAATIQENMSLDTDPHLYPNSIFTGIFQSVLGFLRLGIVVDFLSHSTIMGFISGTETVISQQQLDMFGPTHLTTKTDVISLLHAVLKNRDKASGCLRCQPPTPPAPWHRLCHQLLLGPLQPILHHLGPPY